MNVWNTITEENVMSRFSDGERAALRSLQVIPHQLKNVIGDVVNSTRGKIIAGGGQVGADGTIPDSLRPEVISISLWLWVSGFSKNDKIQTDGRKKNYEDALATLKQVANGEQRVELPVAVAVDQSIKPAISERPRRFKHEDGV